VREGFGGAKSGRINFIQKSHATVKKHGLFGRGFFDSRSIRQTANRQRTETLIAELSIISVKIATDMNLLFVTP